MRVPAVVTVAVLALIAAACSPGGPDGSCVTDYECESDQVCGLQGRCLLCDNCDRGRVGTCTAPAWPRPEQPDSIRIENLDGRDVLIYVYTCPEGASEFRHIRRDGDRCFDSRPQIDDGCGLADREGGGA